MSYDLSYQWLTFNFTYTHTSDPIYQTVEMYKGNTAIYKSILHDHLSFQLYVSDLFGTNDDHTIGKYGKLKELVDNEYSTTKISLTIRYKFNTTRSKYKGTGAGESQKNRM